MMVCCIVKTQFVLLKQTNFIAKMLKTDNLYCQNEIILLYKFDINLSRFYHQLITF